eukprot:scaffold25_cov342-Pavlova_lutheri.AAC.18
MASPEESPPMQRVAIKNDTKDCMCSGRILAIAHDHHESDWINRCPYRSEVSSCSFSPPGSLIIQYMKSAKVAGALSPTSCTPVTSTAVYEDNVCATCNPRGWEELLHAAC